MKVVRGAQYARKVAGGRRGLRGSVESKVNLEGRSQLKHKAANKETPFRPSTETDKLKVAEDIH